MTQDLKINFLVTGACNATKLRPVAGSPGVCAFCFRQDGAIRTTRASFEEVLDAIPDGSILEPVSFTGGEPLISPLIGDMVRAARLRGHRVALHTNGLLLERRWAGLQSHLAYVALPYDGHTRDLADYFRGSGYFDLRANAVDLVARSGVGLAFHTLVTPRNVEHLSAMAAEISSTTMQYWFLKRFKRVNRARGADTLEYRLAEPLFREAVARIRSDHPDLAILEAGQVAAAVRTLFVGVNGAVSVYLRGDTSNTNIGRLPRDSWDEVLGRLENLERERAVTALRGDAGHSPPTPE